MDKIEQASSKRIAKNTLVLFFRMFFVLIVSLYTSRVLLETLGEVDYGVYSVVGGIVIVFSVFSNVFSTAISRFLTYAIGTGNIQKLKEVFSTSCLIQIVLALAIGLIIEVVGFWFLNTKLNIPSERMDAANWVLNCSIIAFVIGIITTPFSALVIAHERMKAFAFVSIFEVVYKLGIVYIVRFSVIDNLKVYSVLLLGSSLVVMVTYIGFCKRNFEEVGVSKKVDKKLIGEIGNFAGWNLFGTTAYMFNTQGVNFLINIFFGVIVNAARGIAMQVEGAITQLVNNFTIALNPQITKSYASGNIEYYYKLVSIGAKYSFFIMLLVAIPIVLEADTILSLWLINVPKEAVAFVQLVVLNVLASAMASPMITAVLATGKIKRYQILVTSFSCLVFPLSWLSFKLGAPAYTTYVIWIIINVFLIFVRLESLKRLAEFPVKKFILNILFRIVIVFAMSTLLPLIILKIMEPSFLRLICTTLVSFMWTVLLVFVIGMESPERGYVRSKFLKLVRFSDN